ncbi:MAG: YihY/virulence factor BrkB family protein [Bryobacteraceae bacterium]
MALRFLKRLVRPFSPTVFYWMETEVHVYAFSIAVNILLAFFPFLIVMVSLCHYVLYWRGAEAAIFLALQDYFPEPLGGFIQRNLRSTVEHQGPVTFVSVFLLFFTANGIFIPLEVAFNRAWGVEKNRSFLRNQIVSLGLIFACGALVLMSTVLTAVNREALTEIMGVNARMGPSANLMFLKAAAIPMSILMLFLVYWILPNRHMPARRIIGPAILVGLTLELLKYLNGLTWPWLRVKLEREYGPFSYSVTIILWSFLAAMIILAGAEWTARRQIRRESPENLIDSQ